MQNITSFIRRYPYACLLAVQLLSVIFYGFMSDTAISRLIFSCFGLAVPILALLVVVRSPAVTMGCYNLGSPLSFIDFNCWIFWFRSFASLGAWPRKHHVLLCSNRPHHVYV